MKVILLLGLLSFLGCHSANAQTKLWSLRECCDYAVEHNISIKQQDNQRRQQELQVSTAKNSRLPDLSGSVGQSFSFGRSLTPDNIYVSRNSNGMSLNLSTSMPLFTGFRIPNEIKMSQLNLEAYTADLEKAKNDVRMQVAQAYVQILYDMEISDVAHRQIEIDSAQVKRLQAFVENGKASEAELSQQNAALANSRLTATQADNNTRLALLTLTQLLELPTPDDFTIVRPAPEELSNALALQVTPDQIYAEALGIKPEIVAQQLRLKAYNHNIKIAKSAHYPTLSFGANMGTNYNSAMPNSMGRQFDGNFAQGFSLNLNVPIFNRFQTRNRVRDAIIQRETQQLQVENTKKTLYKEIQQVYYNALNAQTKEKSSMEALQSSKDAFTLMQAKYENGKATMTEFNEAKNNYLKAESDLVQARYENLYQHALLEFYRGRELTF